MGERNNNRDSVEHVDEKSRRGNEEQIPHGTDENPPRTTKNGITAPKFGSAGSGGAELEPGPERD